MNGKIIAEKRKEKGMTQDALGATPGISGKAVSKWERGLSNPCKEHAEKLVDLLGLSVEEQTKKPERVASTLLSIIKNDFLRIIALGVMLGVCFCRLTCMLSPDSTAVYLGFSVALFCLGTITHSN